jgi:hypothetical protein
MSIASSSTPPLGTHAWLAQLQGGAIGSIVSLAVILTLGLLAYAPLGALAPEVGIPAAFTAAVVGGLAMALLATSALPTAGPSSATALILAALVAKVMADPALQVTHPAGVAAVVALASASIVVMGLLQIAFGVLRLGTLAKFVPQPALAGFMNGVAILILLSQVPALLGVSRGGAARWVRRAGTDAACHARHRPVDRAVGVGGGAALSAGARDAGRPAGGLPRLLCSALAAARRQPRAAGRRHAARCAAAGRPHGAGRTGARAARAAHL